MYMAHYAPDVELEHILADNCAMQLVRNPKQFDVMLVQYRMLDEDVRNDFAARLSARIKSEFGVDCVIELVGAHALPRTSSGKPSRAQARANYLAESGR